MLSKIELREKRGLGKIISDSFNYLRYNFKPLLKIILLVSGPILLIGGVLFGLGYSSLFNSVSRYSSSSPEGFTQRIFLGMFLFGIGAIVMNGLIVEYMKVSLHKEKSEITFKDVIDGFKGNVGNYILGALVILIILSVSVFVFVLPFIWLSMVFSLTFFIIGVEKNSSIDAIGRSFRLINGYWWRSFGLFILMGIIQMGITYAIILPIYIIVFTITLSGGDPGGVSKAMSVIMLFFMPFFMLLTALSYSLSTIAAGVNYFSIVEDKEDIGLKERIEKLDVEI